MKQKITIIITSLLFLLPAIANAQAYKYKYYFDENLAPAAKENAAIIGRGMKTQSGVKADFFLAGNNLLLATTEFTDSSLAVINGKSTSFYSNGNKSQLSNYKMNSLDGLMLKWDSAGRLTDSVIYEKDKPVFKAHKSYSLIGNLIYLSEKDSINNSLKEINYAMDGALVSEVYFSGGKGIYKTYSKDGSVQTDSIFTLTKTEAVYPGGPEAWKRFLERNLDPSVGVNNRAPVGVYTVTIQFIVQKDGSISDIKPLSNLGYGFEDEAIRVIRKSGKWIPAKQYGKDVKAYRKQPLSFQISLSPPLRNPSNF